MGLLSSKKLQLMKDKLQIDDHFRIKNNTKTKNIKSFKYREMLNRAREKSQEHIHNQMESSDEDKENKKSDKNNLRLSNLTIDNINNIEIKSHIKPRNEPTIINNNCKKSQNYLHKNRFNFEEDDEQLISILNSSSIDFYQFNKKKSDLKQSTIDAKADFYSDNLFNLIDEIERPDRNKVTSNFNFDNNNNNQININLQVEKE